MRRFINQRFLRAASASIAGQSTSGPCDNRTNTTSQNKASLLVSEHAVFGSSHQVSNTSTSLAPIVAAVFDPSHQESNTSTMASPTVAERVNGIMQSPIFSSDELRGLSSDEWCEVASVLEKTWLPKIAEKDRKDASGYIRFIKSTTRAEEFSHVENTFCIQAFENVHKLRNVPTTFVNRVMEVKNTKKDEFFKALFGDVRVDWINRVLMLPGGVPEKGRVVKVRCAVRTPFVDGIEKHICSGLDGRTTVVTGESGGGKTFASIMAASSSEKCVALYLGHMSSEFKKLPEGEDAKVKSANDESVAIELRRMVDLVTEGMCLDGIGNDKEAIVSLIVDELGQRRDVLRCICRLSHVDNEAGTKLRSDLQKMFNVGFIKIVAVGTGCDDAVFPAGSDKSNYEVCRTDKESGHNMWRALIADFAPSGNKLFHSLLFRAVGGIALRETDVDQPDDTRLLKEIFKVPGGRLLTERGKGLVGNCRLAALLFSHASSIAESAPTRKNPDQSSLVSSAVKMAEAVVCHSIYQFIDLNGLSSAFLSDGQRLGAIAQAVALMLNRTDATLPEELFSLLSTQSGVLTSHAVLPPVNGVNPLGSRAVGEVGEYIIVDGKHRYRVSPAPVSMYLLGLGAVFRGTSGSDFERLTVDYLTIVAPAAACVCAWLMHPEKEYRRLATEKDQKAERYALFDILVEAFNKGPQQQLSSVVATSEGIQQQPLLSSHSTPSISVFQGQLKGQFEVNNKKETFEAQVRETKIVQKACDQKPCDQAQVDSEGFLPQDKKAITHPKALHEVFTEIAGDSPPPNSLVIAQNGPNASGADIFVLSRDYGFAVHIQNKFNITSAVEDIPHNINALKVQQVKAIYSKIIGTIFSLLGEFVKMGADTFNPNVVMQCLKGMKVFEQVLVNVKLADLPTKLLGNDRNSRDDPFGKEFTNHLFVLLRCVAKDKTLIGTAIKKVLAAHPRTHSNCRYIEAYEGDDHVPIGHSENR